MSYRGEVLIDNSVAFQGKFESVPAMCAHCQAVLFDHPDSARAIPCPDPECGRLRCEACLAEPECDPWEKKVARARLWQRAWLEYEAEARGRWMMGQGGYDPPDPSRWMVLLPPGPQVG